MCVCDWTKKKSVCVCVCVCVCELHAWQALFAAVPSAPGTGRAQRKPLEKIY